MNTYASAPADLLLPAFMRNPVLKDATPELHSIQRLCGWVAFVNYCAFIIPLWHGDLLATGIFLFIASLAAEYWSASGLLPLCGSHVRMFKHCWIRKSLLAIPGMLFIAWLLTSSHVRDVELLMGFMTLTSTVLLLQPTASWKRLTDPFLA